MNQRHVDKLEVIRKRIETTLNQLKFVRINDENWKVRMRVGSS